jgi:hypothetical protein
MKRGTNWFIPALVAMGSVAGLLFGTCGGIMGVVFAVDSHQETSLYGVVLFLTACAVTTGAVVAIRWVAKWKRTSAGETVDLRLLKIGLALVAGGFVVFALMVVATIGFK